MRTTFHRIPFLALWLVIAIPAFKADAQVTGGKWVYPSVSGNLLYQLDERGQRIADFSQCGYRGGTEPLPNVNAVIPQNRWVYLSPDDTTDDTARIQAAIDSVEALTPDANGWRGVVYLNAGEYQLATTLTLNASGVVLKGAGDSATTGSRLRATDPRQYTLISVAGSGSRSTVAGTTRNLTQKLVPAGTRTFEVDSTSGLAVGHTVIVKRPSTANWIADIDMDQLGPAPVVPWTAGSKDLLFDRTITRIDGNWITVDVPLPQTFERLYGGGQIWRYTWSGRIQQVGIEHIYGFSDYASSTDELHGWKFINISNTLHGWVRDITAQYFGYAAVSVGDGAKWLTVADSQCLDPISLIDGGRRYSFNNAGAECTLFVNNYARKGRHDFVFGATVPGPNAFVHGTADTAYNDTGPHHRWSVGGLFDAVTVNGDWLNVQNRGNSGTGHGWAGAYMAVWNSKADGFRVRNPPTARNWLVGSLGTISASSGPVGADPAGTYDSSGPSGTGKAVHPRSLYYGQLQQQMKWPGSDFREAWLGDVDQHTNDGASDTVNCDSTWLAQVEAIGAAPADAKFDHLVGNRHTACTLDFPLEPGDTIVAASLTVSLRGIGSAASDSIWLDSTASPQTYASLGWTPVSTTAPTVRTMEVSPSLLTDGRLNLAFGTNTAVDFATLHLQVQKAQRSTSTITLTPEADAHVQGGTNANTNYGTLATLETKEDTNINLDRETFIRWDLSGVSGKIVQAKVRLAVTSTAQLGNENSASFVSDDSWGETTLTFAEKPASDKLFAQWLPVTGQAAEFIVTPQVLDTLPGDGKLSLRILSTDNHGANGNVAYASRTNVTLANRPQLILSIENPPTAAIKAATNRVLNDGTAWTNNFVPVNPDTATWNATSLTGAMTLGADLSWAKLIINNPAAALTFNGTQFLSLGSGGIDLSASTVDLTLNHRVFLGEDQPWKVAASRTLAVTGEISGSGALTKGGAGNVTLSGTNTYIGDTTIDQGTLAFTTTDSSLPGSLVFGATAANTTAGILDLTPVNATFAGSLFANTNSATASEIKIGPAKTLTINSNLQIGATSPAIDETLTHLDLTGGGILNVSTAAAGSVSVGGSTSNTLTQFTKLDLSALSATTINASTTGLIRVSPNTGQNIGGDARLWLPAPAVADTLATSTLTAGTISVGVGGSFTNAALMNSITLGTGLTTLNANTIHVGTGGRDMGRIIFGQAAGDLILRAADGSSRAAAINIGAGGGGTASAGSPILMDLSGHDADILVTSLNVGNQPRTGNQTYEFKFGTGDNSLVSKLDATHVNIGFRGGNGTTTTTLTSRVNLAGGSITFGAAGGAGNGVVIGGSLYVNAGTAPTIGELNISGGNVTVHHSTSLGAAVRLGSNQAAGGGTVSASINLTGGTTTLGGDIIRNTTSPRTTSTVRISGGTLNMGGHDIGTATEPITLAAESGTLSNIATINGTGGLTKTTAGILTLAGTNTYTGATAVTAGTLALGTINVLPDASTVSISSATLNAASAGTEVAGTLAVTGTATLNLAAGAKIEFLASNGISWPGTLNLTGTFVSGVSLKFGNGTGLTATQLGKISVNGVVGLGLNGSGYLTAPGFPTWIAGTFSGGATVPPNQQGPNDDPDNDGIRNLVEYAIAGQDPTVSDPTVGAFTGTTLSFNKRAGTTGLTYAIQKSTDLGVTDSWVEVTGVSPGYVNDGTTISLTLTPGTPAQNFLRLRLLSN